MSNNVFDAIAWAIKVSKGEPMAARMLLIVGLASRVSNDDFVVWPSISTISEDTDMSESSVRRWLKHLVAAGLVEIFGAQRESGATTSNRYRLPIKAVFYHPTKGAMAPEAPVKLAGGEGVKLTGGGCRLDDRGRVSHADTRSELQSEQQYEGSRESADAELDLGLEPIPPKDPTPTDLALFIASEWVTRAYATPLRGGRLTEASIDKAMKLARENVVEGQTVIDVWRDIFKEIDNSDFLQGKVPGRDSRPPFKLTLSFLLEKRNFMKTLEGRFGGKSNGDRKPGSTSVATGRVLDRVRSGAVGRSSGRGSALAIGHR